jgi:hypothetical protein
VANGQRQSAVRPEIYQRLVLAILERSTTNVSVAGLADYSL